MSIDQAALVASSFSAVALVIATAWVAITTLRGVTAQMHVQTFTEYTRRYTEITEDLPSDFASPTCSIHLDGLATGSESACSAGCAATSTSVGRSCTSVGLARSILRRGRSGRLGFATRCARQACGHRGQYSGRSMAMGDLGRTSPPSSMQGSAREIRRPAFNREARLRPDSAVNRPQVRRPHLPRRQHRWP